MQEVASQSSLISTNIADPRQNPSNYQDGIPLHVALLTRYSTIFSLNTSPFKALLTSTAETVRMPLVLLD